MVHQRLRKLFSFSGALAAGLGGSGLLIFNTRLHGHKFSMVRLRSPQVNDLRLRIEIASALRFS